MRLVHHDYRSDEQLTEVLHDERTFNDFAAVSEPHRREMLDDLSRRTRDWQGVDRRRHVRLRYERELKAALSVEHVGGRIGKYLVRTRDLSTGGIGFLHGAFLPAGSRCAVTLLTTDGQWVDVVGKVVRCTHIHGTVFEIGVKFDQPVDVTAFIFSDDLGQIPTA